MRTWKAFVRVLTLAALLALPVTAAFAQSGLPGADPYTMDDLGTLTLEPYGADTGAPATLPETGAQESGSVWDGASDWPGVTQIIPAPEALPQTGAVESGALTETEPGDVYFSSAAPSVLPETGSKIPEPAIKNWRFEGFTLVPDWAEPGTLPETGAAPMYYPDVPSEPPLLVPVTPDSIDLAAPEALPETGGVQEAEATFSRFVWDGMTYMPDSADVTSP